MTTAMVKSDGRAMLGFEPDNITEAISLSERIAKSALIPNHLRQRPDDVLLTLMYGRELGLGPMQSIMGIWVHNGKPQLYAQTAIGLVKASPLCEYFTLIEITPHHATWETKRRGNPKPTAMTYTIEDAKTAGLVGKETWKAHPSQMLTWRCGLQLGRAEYPEILQGIVDPDEMEEIRNREAREVIVAPPVPQKIAPKPPRDTRPLGSGPAGPAKADWVTDDNWGSRPAAEPAKLPDTAQEAQGDPPPNPPGPGTDPNPGVVDEPSAIIDELPKANDRAAAMALWERATKLSAADRDRIIPFFTARKKELEAAGKWA